MEEYSTNNKWWMVLNPFPEGGKPQMRHETKQSAIDEAVRLAEKTGHKIHVLELVGTALKPSLRSMFKERE